MTTSSTMNSDGRPWYKEPWPWILMAGPFIVIVACMNLIWTAVVTSDGLVTDDYYKQGLAINQRLQRDQQASSLGLHADVMKSGLNVRLMITSDSMAQLPAQIKMRLMHPTVDGQDQIVDMTAESSGFYIGKLSAEVEGRRHVVIEDPAGFWRLQGDWRIGEDAPLRLDAKKVN